MGNTKCDFVVFSLEDLYKKFIFITVSLQMTIEYVKTFPEILILRIAPTMTNDHFFVYLSLLLSAIPYLCLHNCTHSSKYRVAQIPIC